MSEVLTIPSIISILSAVAVVFSVYNGWNGINNKSKEDVAWRSKIDFRLEDMSSDLKELKASDKVRSEKISDHDSRLSVLEKNLESVWKRIDELREKNK